ncbi:MAG: diflavin flavoprotein, partial [Crocosphaera sp.]
DKLLGVHLCNDNLFDEDWKQLDSDRRYYFNCLHAAQGKQVESILDKIEVFSAKYYAPGHGVIVRYSLSRFTYDYRQWCQQQKSQTLKVALLYASAYGNTAILANAIAQGLIDNGLGVDLLNCEMADPDAIARTVEDCDGFIIGSPTLGGHAPVQIQTAVGIVLASASKTKLAGVFGSYGWSGEAIDLISAKLRDANYPFAFNPLRVRFTPDETALQKCQQAGAEFAQTLKKKQKQRISPQGLTEANINRTEQAVGRIIGSICVVTTNQNGRDHAFLTSWVSQASFNPPALMIAISQKQWANSCLEIGESFVLNILQEGRNIRRHFSEDDNIDPLTKVLTKKADNHCLILTEALAYLECRVQQRIQVGDHWLVHGIISQGDVLKIEGVSAIQHRKSGHQ